MTERIPGSGWRSAYFCALDLLTREFHGKFTGKINGNSTGKHRPFHENSTGNHQIISPRIPRVFVDSFSTPRRNSSASSIGTSLRVAVLFQNPKQSKANFAFGLFWPPENPGKAKQSCNFPNPKQSKAKQTKAKQSRNSEIFENILKKIRGLEMKNN